MVSVVVVYFLLLNSLDSKEIFLPFTQNEFIKLLDDSAKTHQNSQVRQCGENSIRISRIATNYCRCKCGFGGNPYKSCYPIDPSTITRGLIELSLKLTLPNWVNDKYFEEMLGIFDEELISTYINKSLLVDGSGHLINYTYEAINLIIVHENIMQFLLNCFLNKVFSKKKFIFQN